jgi:hypothetical protein
MKNIIFFIIAVFLFLILPYRVMAEGELENQRPNNKFGMHIAVPDDGDIHRVAELVNSNGGDWGYITIVIHEDDRDQGKWQGVFDKLRELHLIPIVRIATKAEGDNWRRPQADEAAEWADFLDSLNWVVKDRYVSIYNEPNHAQEWGGAVMPEHYAEVAHAFAEALQNQNDDFFVMPAGFDVAAPANPPAHHDATVFMRALVDYEGPDAFNARFDGWSSHSYPNPGFSASVYKRGRNSITTYDWELSLLKSWGVKDLPVFIKETGWNGDVLSREQIAENYRIAFEEVWIPDDRVRAVTPFILNYQGEPFLKFSWVKPGNAEFHPEYLTTQNLQKQGGSPSIIEDGLFTMNFPQKLVEDSVYEFPIQFKNTGQGIWDSKEGYRLVAENLDAYEIETSELTDIKPNQEGQAEIRVKTSTPTASGSAQIALYRGNERVMGIDTWDYTIEPLPSMGLRIRSLVPFSDVDGQDYTISVYNQTGTVVYTTNDVTVENGVATVSKIRNVSYGDTYEVELRKPYYVSQRKPVVFEKDGIAVEYRNFLPLDFSKDGRFGVEDVGSSLNNPLFISSFDE